MRMKDDVPEEFRVDDFANFINSRIAGVASYVLEGDSIRTSYYSPRLPKVLGYQDQEFDEMVRENALSIVHEDDKIRFLTMVKRAITQNLPMNTTYRVRTKSGAWYWVHLNAQIEKQIGDKYYIHAFFTPMGDEMRLYYDISNLSTNGIYVIEKKTYKVLFVNQQLEKLIEKYYPGTSTIGEKCYKVLLGKEAVCENCVTCAQGRPITYFVASINRYFRTTSHDIMWNGVEASVVYINDITQQEEATQEVTRVYNNIPGAAFRCKFNADWDVISANDGLFTFLGYTRAEFAALGNKMKAVIYPEDQAVMSDRITKQLQEGKTTVENENRLVCKDGTIKWISIKAQLLTDLDGQKYFYCLFVDISKEKEAISKTQESQKNLKIAMKHARMIYWEYDYAKSQAIVSGMAEEYFGIDEVLENYPESYLNMDFVSPEDKAVYRQNMEAMRQGADYREFVARVKTLHTDYLWVKVRLTGVRDEEGKPYKAICTGEPINDYKELEQRFQTILDQWNIDNWIYDIPRHTLMLSKGSQFNSQYAGMEEIPDVPETNIRDRFVHPDDVEKLRAMYKAVDSGQRLVEADMRFWDVQKKAYTWRRTTYTVVTDKSNQPIYAVGSSIDISEQQEAKMHYLAALEYGKHIKPENQILSIHSNITKNKIIDASEGMGQQLVEKFTDVRDKFLLGVGTLISRESERKIFYDTFLGQAAIHRFQLGQNQTSMECDINFTGEKGQNRWVQIQMNVVKEPITKEMEGFVSVLDKTAQKQKDIVFNRALEDNYDYVAILNLDSNKVTAYNRNGDSSIMGEVKAVAGDSYDATYEYVKENMIQDDDLTLFNQAMSRENIRAHMNENTNYECMYYVMEKGQRRSKQVKFIRYPYAENLIILCQTDVTEMLVEQEKQRELLEKSLKAARNADEAKSRFLNRISHDMRTPLNGILGLTTIMKDKRKWQDIQEDLDQLQLSGHYLLELINDTLDVSKIENGKMVLRPVVCDGRVLTQAVLNILKPNLEAKKIKLIVKADQLPYSMLYVDAPRLQQLIMNILSNAVKFTPEGGIIEVTGENISVTDTEIVDRYTVRDTGIGISPEFLPHIFEPFSQEDTERTSKYQGTGLGMAITKKIVELMGGTISVSSVVGEGTTFTFTVKLTKATPKQVEEWEKERAQAQDFTVLKNKKILLCEDHLLNAHIAKKLLEKYDISVEWAKDGAEGVQKFKEAGDGHFDLILMDVRMPVMDGLEATKKIRSMDGQGKTIPIVAMTANALSEDVKVCLESGMNAHVGKPFEPNDLYSTIIRCLSK